MAWQPLISPSLEPDLASILLLQSFTEPTGVLCFFSEAVDLPQPPSPGLWVYSSPLRTEDRQVIVLASLHEGLADLECLAVLSCSAVIGADAERVEGSLKNVHSA
jgi:hypothetical protein